MLADADGREFMKAGTVVKDVLEKRKLQSGEAMKNWPQDELQRIAGTDDLHISPLREDHVTYGTPTWIWCVVVGGRLFVRAYNGQSVACGAICRRSFAAICRSGRHDCSFDRYLASSSALFVVTLGLQERLRS